MAAGRIKIVFALIALGLLASSVLAAIYFWQNVKQAEDQAWEQIAALKEELPPLPDPGADLFEETVALLQEGELDAARTKLLYILKFYEDSSRYQEAKWAIGEMNLDQLISSEPMHGKTDYVVRSGDSLALIASRTNCTVSYIMRANNMISTRIHPGEELLVCPLDFTLVIDIDAKTLTLTRSDQFFKEYGIEQIRMPYGVSVPFSTKLSDKVTYLEGRRVPLTHERVQETEKWLHTKVPGFVLGLSPEVDETVPEEDRVFLGVGLARADLEELFTVLRLSTPVKVIR